jgi:hypothetical protein
MTISFTTAARLRPHACLLLILGLGPALAAQMPTGWNVQKPLGQDQPGPWFGFGLWSADQQGPAATLVDSLGLGNSITGNGFHLEGGLRAGKWDLAAEALGGRTPEGDTFLTLYRGHATWRSRERNGWELGLEREPLVWGYGLNGGYLLGEAARPFPRARVESPMRALHLWRVPLGTWGFQAFMGQMEAGRQLSTSLQNPRGNNDLYKTNGAPDAPFLNGYRLQATFGPNFEFYANYINLWGGTQDGHKVTEGYNFGEYLTSMFGLKDTLAEANADPSDPNPSPTPYKNKARSASNSDVGLRMRLRPLEGVLGAQTVHAYLSRGSKNIWWNPGLFLGNPIRYGWRDIREEARRLSETRLTGIWNNTGRYTAPNLTSPNDALGLLVTYPGLRLGLEYLDTADDPQAGVRSFTHYIYLSGFYTHGDPLGNAIAGEARTTTARIEADLTPRLTSTTLLHLGTRPFRDTLSLWQADHPDRFPAPERFWGFQQAVKWQFTRNAALDLGVAWQRHTAVDNLPGNDADAFRYHADVSYRWPAKAN